MAGKPRQLAVEFSQRSLAKLDEIWDWNYRAYGLAHADVYVQFLRDKANRLSKDYSEGQIIQGARGIVRYLFLKWKKRGHCHIVLYRELNEKIDIIDFFHTAQDWQSYVKLYS